MSSLVSLWDQRVRDADCRSRGGKWADGVRRFDSREMGCFIVEKHLNRFIEGKCVSDIKLIHDQMLGATMYYSGSGGLVMNTISCVDLALWDLFGKVVGLPIYKLLGGAVRDEIQFYATGARPIWLKKWALSAVNADSL